MSNIIKLPGKLIDLDVIANSGQVFRWKEGHTKGSYLIPSDDFYGLVWKEGNSLFVEELSMSEEEFQKKKSIVYDFWKIYFNLGFTPYFWNWATHYCNNHSNPYMKKILEYGKGMTILNQAPFETLISFIISQNNNIPRIKQSIEKLCEQYGDRQSSKYGDWFSFPDPLQIARNSVALDYMGLGYRASYVRDAVYMWLDDFWICDDSDSYECKRKSLMEIHGVGPKVADCVCLYGFSHYEAFPIDTHIRQAMEREHISLDDEGIVYRYRGFLQQLIFYYEINHKNLES